VVRFHEQGWSDCFAGEARGPGRAGLATKPGAARFPCRRHCDGIKHSGAEHPDHAPDLNFKKAKAASMWCGRN